MAKVRKQKKQKKQLHLMQHMRKKLMGWFIVIVILMALLAVRISTISLQNGEKYQKIVLSQQEYNNTSIPYRRGDIVDRKGTVLATSNDVYKVILDCSVITSKDDYLEPTLDALSSCFDVDEGELRDYINNNPESRYYVCVKNKVSFDQKLKFEELQTIDDENDSKEVKAQKKNIKGIWFEKEYVRTYPYQNLASSLIGFTASGNVGIGGIEDKYSSTLNGVNGRTYGYVNEDSNFESTVKDAIDGNTVVTSIDINLQSIVERKIQEFNEGMSGKKGGRGAENIGVIMMDPNTAEILAMANYPNFDLNDPWNLDTYYSTADQEKMTDEEKNQALNEMWRNFAITYTYEPGSTQKIFTVATGLETGSLKGDEVYMCDGFEEFTDYKVRCVNRDGHGEETIAKALSNSCNDALMQMSYSIGAHNFARYQQIFNFGLKTNIDLPGESRTQSLLYTEEQLNRLNLAINSFGQNFNVTMIQMASAYCSVVNGGNYYLPHTVIGINDSKGNTVQEIGPTLLKSTVSQETTDMMIEYLRSVVSEGTGKVAKVDGYSMCGKTGTGQMVDPETHTHSLTDYLLSFIGSVPAENPQVVIYVIVDRPYTEDQAHSTFAQNIVREILEEALPYLNIYPDEEKMGTNANLDIMGNEEYSSETTNKPDTLDYLLNGGSITENNAANNNTETVTDTENDVPETELVDEEGNPIAVSRAFLKKKKEAEKKAEEARKSEAERKAQEQLEAEEAKKAAEAENYAPLVDNQ